MMTEEILMPKELEDQVFQRLMAPHCVICLNLPPLGRGEAAAPNRPLWRALSESFDKTQDRLREVRSHLDLS